MQPFGSIEMIRQEGDRRMDIRAALTELCAAFNAHDLDRIMALFADDCVLEMPRGNKPWGSRSEGKQNVRSALATRFEGLPDVHYGNEEHFIDAAANTGMSKWFLTGTTRDGIRREVRGCDFYTFRDGKVIRKDSYWKIVE
jgi:ketosteroid isomerase-like protein